MRAVASDPEKAEIVERYQGAVDLVLLAARQIHRAIGPSVSFAELESCGNEGLLDAARRFDANRGVPFRAYAYVRIRGAILDGVRAIMPLPRRTWEKLRGLEALERASPRFDEDGLRPASDADAGPGAAGAGDAATEADNALGEHLAAMATAMTLGMLSRPVVDECGELTLGDDEDPEQVALRAERDAQLDRAIQSLPLEESIIVRRHYLEGQRFDVVARELGLSKSWASRLHRRAMERLAKRLHDMA